MTAYLLFGPKIFTGQIIFGENDSTDHPVHWDEENAPEYQSIGMGMYGNIAHRLVEYSRGSTDCMRVAWHLRSVFEDTLNQECSLQQIGAGRADEVAPGVFVCRRRRDVIVSRRTNGVWEQWELTYEDFVEFAEKISASEPRAIAAAVDTGKSLG